MSRNIRPDLPFYRYGPSGAKEIVWKQEAAVVLIREDREHSMLKNLRGRLDAFWRQLEHGGSQERRVLVMMGASSCQDTLRVFAIENRWHLSFAPTFQNAMIIQHAIRSNVIIYDQELPEVDWRQGLQTILACAEPAMAIVLSHRSDARMYRSVLDCGAFALARKPLQGHDIVLLVNSALQLAEDINSLCVSESMSTKR